MNKASIKDSSGIAGNDYVAVAKFRLEGVHEQQSDEGMTDATMIAAALDAQTQATLASVYEQRTANLIAMMDHAQADAKISLADLVLERLGLIERDTK